MATPLPAEPQRHPVRPTLFRCDDGAPFAYARRQEMIRCSDNRPWAYLSNDRLVSVRSGDCLAFRIGNFFCDAVTRDPIYYVVP
jgi:hypothetical protein